MATVLPAAPPTKVVDTAQRAARTYSPGTKRWQRNIRGLSRSTLRLSDAISQALQDYRDRSDRSSRKKRDGELRDLPKNVARAMEVAFTEAGKAPGDWMSRIGTRRFYKRSRNLIRLFWR